MFWRDQSANELRNQLKLRDPHKFKDEWAFKSKPDLIKIIKELIEQRQMVEEEKSLLNAHTPQLIQRERDYSPSLNPIK